MDDDLRTFLVGIFESLKIQQKMLQDSSISGEALVDVLSAVAPDFRKAFDAKVQDLTHGLAGQTHRRALAAIEDTIAKLQKNVIPTKFPKPN